MIPTLLVDAIRRKRFGIAFGVFQGYLLSKILLKIWPEAQIAACAVAFAGFGQLTVGPLLFQSRELYILPVSRQTWWRASWWIGTAGVSAMAVIGVTLGAWEVRSEVPAFAPASLTFVLCFLYCGLGKTLLARYQRPLDAPATLSSLVLAPFFILWIVAAPFVLASSLPHAWSDLSLAASAVLVMVAAMGVPGYLHRPAIEARLSMRAARPVAQLAATSQVDTLPARPAFADRLTGCVQKRIERIEIVGRMSPVRIRWIVRCRRYRVIERSQLRALLSARRKPAVVAAGVDKAPVSIVGGVIG